MKRWVIGARVKTLPAAIAPVLVGTAYASQITWLNAALAMIVSLSLQIGVNFSNDYSDGIKGVDANRVGPTRLVASGLANAKSVKAAAIVSFLVAAVAGLILAMGVSYWLIAVGALAIWAAWGYTGGKKPYGYFGFGELSVFIFFGLVATIGSYFVQTQEINWQIFILAIPVGSHSCAILAINNLRDLPQDALAGKRTMAVKIGEKNTRRFFVLLLVIAQFFAAGASAISLLAFFTLLCLPLTYLISKQVLAGAVGKELIALLSHTAKLQLLMAVLLTTALVI
ncbi:MAG: 1,4-dihydroxy-2-naphthoate polyprenyltransferase [Actinobacteria bacterium]|nr:1,4-dihydroxy-2-naphthoate polyprenyltransferase [Actinomycetota bacterium]